MIRIDRNIIKKYFKFYLITNFKTLLINQESYIYTLVMNLTWVVMNLTWLVMNLTWVCNELDIDD